MTSRPPRIALLLRGGIYTYQDDIIAGAHQQCAAEGVNLYVLSGGNVTTADPRNFIYTLPGPGDVDAVVIVKGSMAANDGDAVVGALLQRLRRIPTCIIGPSEAGVRCVAIDNSSGVRGLTRHLIEKHERRRIAFISGHGREADQRLAGYRAGHRDRGLMPDERLLVRGEFRVSGGQEAVATLFDGGPGCDAIVAANDWMALGALEALRARGIRVPEDVAVVGFDDIDEAGFATPPLTTVRQSPRQLGIEAVRLVLDSLRGGEAGGDVVLETLPQIRQSCGCSRAARHGDVEPPAHAGPKARRHHYGAWIQATAARGPAPGPSVPADWAARLVESLRRDLEAGTNQRFIATLDDIVGRAAALGDVSAWHQPVATLRREVIRDLASGTDTLALAESIFERAHIHMGDQAARAQGRRRVETEAAWRAVEELGTEVRKCLDRPSIGRALAAHLPGLHVRSCGVVVNRMERPPTSNDEARLIIGWDQERGLSTFDGGVSCHARELVPEVFRPARRHTVMVQPLWSQGEALGWCLLEMDPPRAIICESIPPQISASLKATAQQQRLAAETTKRERAERAQLEYETDLAARIQTSILPRDRRVSGLTIAATMLPATEVGGDYFDILPFDGGCWLGIGDVTGHGLHAGLVTMMIQSIVSALTYDRAVASPAKVWTALNGVLYDNLRTRLQRDERATLTLIRYEKSGRLLYAGAHEDLIVWRARGRRCELLRTQGSVRAGMARDVADGTIRDEQCQLEPGDALLLYTDGITQAMNAAREAFGIERLCRTLEHAATGSAEEIRDRILSEVRGFMSAQRDDMTLVVLRYR